MNNFKCFEKLIFFFQNKYDQPQQFSKNVSPSPPLKYNSNGRSSQQSIHDTSQSRLSQQNISGLPSVESTSNNTIANETDNKYTQENFETEKSNRRLSNTEDDSQSDSFRRRGSIRFYEEDSNIQRRDSASNLQQKEPDYIQKEFEHKENLQEYNHTPQEQDQTQMYTQPEFTDQGQYEESGNIYASNEYNAPQYIEQQNYNDNQYGTNANEYDYQNEYQEFDAQNYTQPGNELPPESLYQSEQYQNEDPEFGIQQNQSIQQQQQGFTEPTSGIANTQRYRTNGNNPNTTVQRQSMSTRQPTKKK